ncbi:hypothetical protein PG989_015912 [Apiospora arundinis]
MAAATTPEALWEVRRIPNKGCGVVATALIEPGTRILMEKPLYIRPMTDDPIPEQNSIVESLIRNLSDPAQRNAFHELASSFSVLYPDHPYYSIATTNEVVLSGAQAGASGLFLQWSRFNHACTPSAYWAWNDEGVMSGTLTVHAIRRIQPGDEISISYFENRVMSHDDRERYLAEIYCFSCDCALCSLAPGPWRDDVDERLDRLEAFWRKYHLGEEAEGNPSSTTTSPSQPSNEARTNGPTKQEEEGNSDAVIDVKARNRRRYLNDPEGCFADCREAAELILEAEEDVDGDGGGGEDGDIAGCIDLTFAYEIALALTLALGDAARASVFAVRNQARYTVTLGADSVSAVRAGVCAQNPRADRTFGSLNNGGKRIEIRSQDVPDVEEIGEEAFEEWLWSTEDWHVGEDKVLSLSSS